LTSKSTNASEIQQEVLFNKLFISRASKLTPANKIVLLRITSGTAGESTEYTSRSTSSRLISGLDSENSRLFYECKDVYTAMFTANTK